MALALPPSPSPQVLQAGSCVSFVPIRRGPGRNTLSQFCWIFHKNLSEIFQVGKQIKELCIQCNPNDVFFWLFSLPGWSVHWGISPLIRYKTLRTRPALCCLATPVSGRGGKFTLHLKRTASVVLLYMLQETVICFLCICMEMDVV